MSVLDVNRDAVLLAIAAGHDTDGDLAERFGVLQASAALRLTLSGLRADGLVRRIAQPGTAYIRYEVVGP